MKSLPSLGAVLALVLALLSPVGSHAEQARRGGFGGKYVRLQIPELFTYDELVALSKSDPLPPAIEAKLKALTTTPFISNEAFYRGARPHRPLDKELGRSMRVVFWNIERGMRLDDIKLIATDREAFIRKVTEERFERKHKLQPEVWQPAPEDELELEADLEQNFALVRAQIVMLQEADVIVLNEVDWGVPRTQYREVVRELGQALNMNWAYGVEFLEIDPKILGTETWEEEPDPATRASLEQHFSVDRRRVKAMHGSAILSRYPIVSASTTPFQTKGYDWFTGEGGLPLPERVMRSLSGVFAGDKLIREMRRGGRTAVRVELDVPDLPEGRLSVVTPHLENRAKPSDRRRQMAETLDAIKGVNHPVIIAGDFNSNGSNLAPESFSRIARSLISANGLANIAARFLTPYGLMYSALHFGVHALHTQSDPTVADIPIIADNPERGLFELLETFRFDDGGAFDFRGDLERSVDGKHEGPLSNSNQRRGRGFAATFEIGTHVASLGKYKLDWILVKSYLKRHDDPAGEYRFAPHGAWTMKLLNLVPAERLSDHHPMAVTLPFAEPKRKRIDTPPARAIAANASTLDLGRYTCGDDDELRVSNRGNAELRSVWGHGYRAGRTHTGRPQPAITYDMVEAHISERRTACTGPADLWIDSLRRLGPLAIVAPEVPHASTDITPATYSCAQFLALQNDDLGISEAQMVWAHGWASGRKDLDRTSAPVSVQTIVAFADRLLAACRAEPQRLWMDAVETAGQ
ncbi:MAG: endonuclease/exonuclease/phosphatase family protein [Acidobacteriota bacterium]|nr:endonuclease/exonuclease/phosphatase family protein [Acidobacteriota bacterium]